MGQRGPEQEGTSDWQTELVALHQRIKKRFVHPEAHRRALAYLKALLGSVERKNSWQLAKHAGDARPDGMQRLLSTYRWDADGVRDDLRDYVVEHLGDEQAVLVVDEIGFLKQGRQSVGVERQYNRTAGRRENCQVRIFLAYASRGIPTFMDRELYLGRGGRRVLQRLLHEAVVGKAGRRLRDGDAENGGSVAQLGGGGIPGGGARALGGLGHRLLVLIKGAGRISVSVKRVRISDWREMFTGTVAAIN